MGKINKADVLIALGKNIKKIRLLRGITQENLASDLQKSVNFVSLVENGKTGISIPTLVNMCNALNTDFNSMFAGIITLSDTKSDDYIISSLNFLNEKDKEIVKQLITYIINSSNKQKEIS